MRNPLPAATASDLPRCAVEVTNLHDLSAVEVTQRHDIPEEKGAIDAKTRNATETHNRDSHRLNRRNWITVAASLMAAQTARADDATRRLYVVDDIDRAVARGVDFLTSFAQPDGRIADRGHHVAMTSLAIMAMAALGTDPAEPTRTWFGDAKCDRFCAQQKKPNSRWLLSAVRTDRGCMDMASQRSC